MIDTGFIRLLELLRAAKRVLVVSDGRPDGDSIGSSTATLSWLARDFPHLHLQAFCRETIPPSLLSLSHIQSFSTDRSLFTQPWDLILMHDASNLEHGGIEDILPLTPKGYTLVNIDHHTSNTLYGQINIVHTNACSTTEVLYQCLTQHKIFIDPEMANSLLAGLLTDTSSFTNSGTTASSLAMAGDLKRLGARYEQLQEATMSRQSLESLQLWGKLLSRLQKRTDLHLAITYVFAHEHEGLNDEEALGGLSNMLNARCGDVETVIVLKETSEGLIKGSCRSTKRDISLFCAAFGGGGHKKASGFSLKGKLEERKNGGVRIVPISSQ